MVYLVAGTAAVQALQQFSKQQRATKSGVLIVYYRTQT